VFTKSVNFNNGGNLSITGVGNETGILAIDLPVGSFVVQGKVEIVNGSGNDADVFCTINGQFEETDAQTIENNSVRALHPAANVTLSAPGSVAMTCEIGLGLANQTVITRNSGTLTAIQVDTITTQP
jgi:hypothetical protein